MCPAKGHMVPSRIKHLQNSSKFPGFQRIILKRLPVIWKPAIIFQLKYFEVHTTGDFVILIFNHANSALLH